MHADVVQDRARSSTRKGRRVGEWMRHASSYPRELLLLALFVVSLPAVTTRLYASDEIQYFAYLRSLWFDRDLSFDDEYRYFMDRGIAQGSRPRADGTGVYGGNFRQTFLETETATGLRVNFAPIGTALLWAPFYLTADAGVRIARALGSTVAADGFSQPYIAAVTYASAFYGFLAVLLSTVALRRIFGEDDLSAVPVWVGTPLLFYTYVAPGYSHACSAAVVAAFVVVWLHVRQTWTTAGIVVLGALAALMGMVREQDGFIAIGPAVDFAMAAIRSIRVRTTPAWLWLARACAGVATTLVCLLPQAAAYLVLFGRLGPSSHVQSKMSWTAPYLGKLLASTDYGAFFWTPLLVPAFVGLAALAAGRLDPRAPGATERRWTGVVLALIVGSQLWVSGSVSSWTGSAFGQRRLLGLTICLVIGVSALLRLVPTGWRRRVTLAAVCGCVWWNLGLIAQYGSGAMNRQQLELGRNAYYNFVTLPVQLPRLTYRYFFDRASFYNGPSGRVPSGRVPSGG